MSNRFTSFLLGLTSVLWYSAIFFVLAIGWSVRDQNYLVAESGIGYWFGIIGGLMMLLIFAYPLRKRFKRWASIGSVKSWFRFHMFLGAAGPVTIIFHSGFKLGSFNSSIAFFCMLIVASSGLLGRYWYQRIHHGLYGSKVRFEEFYSNEDLSKLLTKTSVPLDKQLIGEFQHLEENLTHRHTGINRSLGFYRGMKKRINQVRKKVARSALQRAEKKPILARLKNLQLICKLGINEILFSYWHVLHIPLLVMLILTAIIHVLAVHLY